jgi:hypothetical protein
LDYSKNKSITVSGIPDMPTTKKRPPASTVVAKSAIEQAGTSLQSLPEKPKQTWSLREAVAVLREDITTALSRGYSYEEVVALLAKSGVAITVSSLKRYLASAKRAEGDKSNRRVRRRATGKVSTKQVEAAAAAAQEASSSTPPKAAKTVQKAAARNTTATASKSAAKSAAKSAPKAATKTAKVPRSTVARSRKK